MALNIKDPETELLATQVAELAHETKTRAIRAALAERKERLALMAAGGDPAGDLRRFLEQEVWPQIPDDIVGTGISRAEREEILGYGKGGV